LAEARAELAERRADRERLRELIGRASAEAGALLESTSWRLGDLLVHRVAKRLAGRRNLSAPWAPEMIAEVSRAWERWRAEAGDGRQEGLAEGTEPGGRGLERGQRELFQATVETEHALQRLGRELADAGRDVRRLQGWLRKLVQATDQLLASNRWRVGAWLWGRPAGWIGRVGGGRSPSLVVRAATTRELVGRWERERGGRYSRFVDGPVPPALGPAAPRPRLARGEHRIAYAREPQAAGTVSIVILNRDGATQLNNLFVS